MDVTGLMAIVLFFFSVAAIWGAYIFTRHRERVMMIEKGLSSEEIKSIYQRSGQARPLSALKWGIILVSVGLALVASLIATEVLLVDEAIYPALIALFGGLGLVLFYRIARNILPQT